MVTKWGMSEVLGPLTYGDEQEMVFLGREIAQHRDYSEETARLIDSEVKKIVSFAFDRACTILKENDAALHRLAEGLLEREILDREEIALILEGKPLPAEEEESAKKKQPAVDGTAQAPAEPAQVLAAERTDEPAGPPAQKTDHTNGRRAGESTRVPEPAARAEDSAPGEA
jgi:cell division protease FtsH